MCAACAVRCVRACVCGSVYHLLQGAWISFRVMRAGFRWTRLAPCLAMISLLLDSSHALTCGGKPVPAEFGA